MENGNTKVKLMCSYGGKIQPRPYDHRLSYVSGDTKILSVDRHAKFSDLIAKLTSIAQTPTFAVKYQLPGEDLDALVSLTNDDDLENMMVEYDRIHTIPARLRLFLFPLTNSEPGRFNPNPDYLFGFDKEICYDAQSDPVPTRTAEKRAPEITEKVEARESHVTVNGSCALGPTVEQAVYLIPVTKGGRFSEVRFVYPEQPVYSYVAPVTATVAAKDGKSTA